jgi:hypothetical protein
LKMDGAHANAHETAPCINPCMWSGEEAENLKKPMLVPAKLLAPTVVRGGGWSNKAIVPGNKAEAALQTAKDLFDNYLANAEYAPPLVDLVHPWMLGDYKQAAGEGFNLYRCVRASKRSLKEEPEHTHMTHVLMDDNNIKKEAYHPLIDFHLTIDAGKLFAEYVSIWPGCFAMRRGTAVKATSSRKLTDDERAARGVAHNVSPTDVVVSQEGYIAYRSGNVTELSESQKEYMEFRDRKIAMGAVGYDIPQPINYPIFLHKDEVKMRQHKDRKRQREDDDDF